MNMRLGLPLALLGLFGCQTATADSQARLGQLPTVLIKNVPHIEQKPDFCGEACVAMALQRLGHRHTQDDVFASTRVSPTLGRGAITRELAAGLKRIGFKVGPVWHRVQPRRARTQMRRHFRALHADLVAGIPSIICTRYDGSPKTTEHFRLILGYDAKTDEVIYHEPAEAKGKYKRMARAKVLKLWPLKYRRDRWTVIRLRLAPGEIQPPAKGTPPHTPAGYAQHIRKVKRTIRSKRMRGSFHIVIQRPFVVIGDESPAMVRRRARRTVKWAVDRLKKDYFPKDPARIISIWLFKNRRSYLQNTIKLTGSRPGTPFGFYSDTLDALIMNIATGGGTLVHEIVHPFVEANFPNCPAWFNEGLGSLYEACGEKNSRIQGFLNWRLPGLQQAIRRREVPSFRTLTSQTQAQFYQADPGTNYSQSRYLLYYLEQKGLLRSYYHRFLKNRRSDPTGYATLKKTLGVDDMVAFKRSWERWILRQRWHR